MSYFELITKLPRQVDTEKTEAEYVADVNNAFAYDTGISLSTWMDVLGMFSSAVSASTKVVGRGKATVPINWKDASREVWVVDGVGFEVLGIEEVALQGDVGIIPPRGGMIHSHSITDNVTTELL